MGKPHLLRHKGQFSIRFIVLLFLATLLCGTSKAGKNEVLVVGDTRLKPVVQIIEGIEDAMDRHVPVFSPQKAKGKLANLVKQHGARTVIALGRQSIDEALTLPSSITVLYDLVILPLSIDRPNTAGLYMGTPIKEYLKLVKAYLPDLKKICVIASPQVLSVLDDSAVPQITIYRVTNTFDFVNTIKNLQEVDALLLLPDISLLTQKALEEIYLFSFRKKVPLLGISKKHVRQGALFALEFEPESSGRSLGIMAENSLKRDNFIKSEALPPQHFNLYINRNTAKKMDIAIPEEMLEMASAVYP
ncbi:MAG: ABC transporter substrate-binding protein [Desulfobulbaceae bacterium]|nr:ABC transporter substrate-binding protein [Desulfobulbaceae bacterium]